MKRKEKKKYNERRRKRRRKIEEFESIENHTMFYGPIEEVDKKKKYQAIVREKLNFNER